VLVVADTVRADHLGLYGYDRPTSPALDALAAKGMRYDRAYAQAGWTLPSITTLLTGLYPHQHQVGRDPKQPDRFGCLPDTVTTLPEIAATAGYRTGAFFNNTFLAPEFGLQQGFDRYDFQGATNDNHRSAAQTVTDGLTWLAGGDTPAFLLLHFMEPHLDYQPPSDVAGTFATGARPDELKLIPGRDNPFTLMQMRQLVPSPEGKAFTVALYDEELLAVDRAMAALSAGLAGRDREALVVFTSDHGEEFWDHGGFEHGHALWSELTRVPLIVAGPGFSAGSSDAVVEHLDLFQTLVAVAGGLPPATSGGADLRHLPAGERAALSENCLYGPPCISLVDRQARLVFDPVQRAARVWALDDHHETGPHPDQQAQGQRLLAALQARRGHLDPLTVAKGTRVPSFETFQQLAALGYIDSSAAPGEAGEGGCGRSR